jgi:uncharacterized repeat protein (TIGR03806 family)
LKSCLRSLLSTLLLSVLAATVLASAVLPASGAEREPLRVTAVDTSRLMGSPDPLPPMEFERAFPQMRIINPVQPTHAGDGSGRVFVATQQGTVLVFPNDEEVTQGKVFLDIRDRVIHPGGDNGMFAIAFHPRFRDSGEFFLVYGTRARPKSTVVSRFRVSADDPDRADPDSEEKLIEIVQPWPDHNAACLDFGPDGYLYIALGDGGYSLQNGNAQDLSTLLGSMLRIDVDRRDEGLAYAIPADNPLVGVDSARAEIWAYGLRAPWRFSFDRVTGDCWLGDNGQIEFEEIDLIKPGANYGWMPREGSHSFDRATADERGRPILKKPRQREAEPDTDDRFTDPVIEYDHSQGRSVVGGIVYRGTRLPELIGAYIYGDYANGNIWALRWDGEKVLENRLIARTRLKISSFGESEQGELWFSAMDGYIYRLKRAQQATAEQMKKFPELLSQTGLFESVPNHGFVAGIVPYSVNVPLWSDGAVKDRYVAVPGTHLVGFHEVETWDFPVGSVFIKTFSLDLVDSDPESRRRLETRLLVHNPRGWVGYTYRWNEAQTDAYLLGGAVTATYTVRSGEHTRDQTWYFPSREDCIRCHTRAAGFALGANTHQLNRQHDYDGHAVNQLAALETAGLFQQSLAKPPESFPAFHDWESQSGSLSERARAYLAVNCSTCHTPPGYTRIDLRFDTPLDQSWMINRDPEKPRVGPPDSRLILPGAPERSELFLRMLSRGSGRMPNIASSEIHQQAVRVIGDWIKELGQSESSDELR